MSEMFKNYPQPEDYIPDNRPKCHIREKLSIMSGETASHSFEIPFNVLTDTLGVEVIYKVGVEQVLVKNNENLEIIVDEDGNSIITCVISSQESLLFRHNILDAKVQIKFIMNDKSIKFSEIYDVKVVNSLENLEPPHPPVPPVPPVPPGPGYIGGLGYTED